MFQCTAEEGDRELRGNSEYKKMATWHEEDKMDTAKIAT
jgi:hypothetical protein